LWLYRIYQGAPPAERHVFRWEAIGIGFLIAEAQDPLLVRGRMRAVGMLGVAALAAVYLASIDRLASASAWSAQFLVIAAFFGAAVALALNLRGTAATAFLRLRSLRWVGERSFSIYLLHQLTLHLSDAACGKLALPATPLTRGASAMFALTVTLVAASALWRFFEGPLNRHAHEKFRYGPKKPGDPAAQYQVTEGPPRRAS
jgi:peptidoglycan/LPS O-acetylase OafA/YrhL